MPWAISQKKKIKLGVAVFLDQNVRYKFQNTLVAAEKKEKSLVKNMFPEGVSRIRKKKNLGKINVLLTKNKHSSWDVSTNVLMWEGFLNWVIFENSGVISISAYRPREMKLGAAVSLEKNLKYIFQNTLLAVEKRKSYVESYRVVHLASFVQTNNSTCSLPAEGMEEPMEF